jgi:hypothetical protein
MRVVTPSIFLVPGRAGKGMLRSGVVEDVVRGVGYGVLKLVTFGTYRSGDSGLLSLLIFGGCVGVLVLATLFFVLQQFVA